MIRSMMGRRKMDRHTVLLMRFEDSLSVEGNTPYKGDGIDGGGSFVIGKFGRGYQFNGGYGMMDTKKVLPDYMGDRSAEWTIDFWFKLLTHDSGCCVGHEWFNGLFYFGVIGDSRTYFAISKGSYGGGRFQQVDDWWHIAITKRNDVGFSFYINGKKEFERNVYQNATLRSYNIDFARQRDGNDRPRFVIDNFRISDIARWTADFDVSTV